MGRREIKGEGDEGSSRGEEANNMVIGFRILLNYPLQEKKEKQRK